LIKDGALWFERIFSFKNQPLVGQLFHSKSIQGDVFFELHTIISGAHVLYGEYMAC
jgi:hypothetical protein